MQLWGAIKEGEGIGGSGAAEGVSTHVRVISPGSPPWGRPGRYSPTRLGIDRNGKKQGDACMYSCMCVEVCVGRGKVRHQLTSGSGLDEGVIDFKRLASPFHVSVSPD